MLLLQEHQHPIEIVHTPDQNKTDLEKAFDYLYERKIAAVNVVWATGKRTDHTITNTNIVRYREKLEIVILDDHSKVFYYLRNSKNGIQQTLFFAHSNRSCNRNPFRKFILCFTR
jgi:thiamine pyrophosphokinase